MKFHLPTLPTSYLAVVSSLVLSCVSIKSDRSTLTIEQGAASMQLKDEEARAKIPIKLADGLKINLWASDSLAPDPIAMSITDDGTVYLTRTNREKKSEFDIRGYQNWMTESIGFQTVDDRRAFLRKTFAPEKSAENTWFPDLNEDGSHDWRDLTVQKEEVWRIQDRNKDGYADVSTRILSDFNEEITDVALGLLVRERDAFISVAPDIWRLQDSNGDGKWDKKQVIASGFGVHIGFGGHGMSGIIEGPDGRIYWGIGDIGAEITTVDGRKIALPNEGMIVRCNPDGTDLEVFASGLRNTHEFVFDQYGNIISSDNDGDHPGESERLVHLVEGSDAGWRSNWQYGKYTDAKNNAYKVWMDEKLYVPRWDGQAAYIIPPIMNYHNGPTGMQFNPGTALGKEWLNKFFLVEFVGYGGGSHIWSFGLKQKGASFVLDSEKDMLSGILPTGIKFGPDGALYVADWITGWNAKDAGRVWKIDVADDKQDLLNERKETQRLMQLAYRKQTLTDLKQLLAYSDMRIRQKAQFELVERGTKSISIFQDILLNSSNQLAKIHAIWGLGQLARRGEKVEEILFSCLSNEDDEIVAQAAKTIGDARLKNATDKLLSLLTSTNPRIQFYAAEALGRIGSKKATESIVKMLEKNDDNDVYLRHAGVLALSRIGAEDDALALATHALKSMRTAGVLVLRRLKSPKISVFLRDSDEYIVTEAARAIHDDTSIPASLPDLAQILTHDKFKSEPLLRRAISAALRVGGEEELGNLISFVQRESIPESIKAEAIAALGTWANPSVLDRVDGRYRGSVKRDENWVRARIVPIIPTLLNTKNSTSLVAFAQMISHLQLVDFTDELQVIFEQTSEPSVQIAVLQALAQLNYRHIEPLITQGMSSGDANVRTSSIGLLSQLTVSKEQLPTIVSPILGKGSLREKQRLMQVLGTMPADNTRVIFQNLIEARLQQKLEKELWLDVSDALDNSGLTDLKSAWEMSKPSDADTEEEGLQFGGIAWKGRDYFNYNSTGQCARCHSIGENGVANVGPNLAKIGSKLDRKTLLQALLNPSARLAPGFGQVALTLKDGQQISGTLTAETEDMLVLTTTGTEPTRIPKTRIATRENYPSSMPPMGTLMSKKEIRDMVEFLASLK